ncbi:unnamed protein product [Heterobilharzia americana]|nr:unnamed protein product [Heterobilharzia americana]CAH8454107.1 unnamed protein product [Heterobilharzia americana]
MDSWSYASFCFNRNLSEDELSSHLFIQFPTDLKEKRIYRKGLTWYKLLENNVSLCCSFFDSCFTVFDR